MAINPNFQAPFSRRAYSSEDPAFTANVPSSKNYVRPQPFAGGDLQAAINSKIIGNLEALAWSISTEIAPQYAFGDRDPRSFVKGKRVIVGSMSMTQWTKHALIEEVFNVSEFNHYQALTLGRLWDAESQGAQLTANTPSVRGIKTASGTTGGVGAATQTLSPAVDETLTIINTATSRGLSKPEFERQQRELAYSAALRQGQKRVIYSDQIPPFDVTITGVNKEGYMSTCTIFGLEIQQETDGKSMNDMNPTVGFSFICRRVEPWREINRQELGLF